MQYILRRRFSIGRWIGDKEREGIVSLNDQTVYTKLKVNHTLDILLTAQNDFAGFVIHGLDQISE